MQKKSIFGNLRYNNASNTPKKILHLDFSKVTLGQSTKVTTKNYNKTITLSNLNSSVMNSFFTTGYVLQSQSIIDTDIPTTDAATEAAAFDAIINNTIVTVPGPYGRDVSALFQEQISKTLDPGTNPSFTPPQTWVRVLRADAGSTQSNIDSLFVSQWRKNQVNGADPLEDFLDFDDPSGQAFYLVEADFKTGGYGGAANAGDYRLTIRREEGSSGLYWSVRGDDRANNGAVPGVPKSGDRQMWKVDSAIPQVGVDEWYRLDIWVLRHQATTNRTLVTVTLGSTMQTHIICDKQSSADLIGVDDAQEGVQRLPWTRLFLGGLYTDSLPANYPCNGYIYDLQVWDKPPYFMGWDESVAVDTSLAGGATQPREGTDTLSIDFTSSTPTEVTIARNDNLTFAVWPDGNLSEYFTPVTGGLDFTVSLEHMNLGVNTLGVKASYADYRKATDALSLTIAEALLSYNDATLYAPLKASLVLDEGTGSPTLTRATAMWVFDNENKMITVPASAAALGGARAVRNLLASPDVLATQGVTTLATTYTISFYGTGSVAFSGTYAGASLAGTGVSDRVQRTFTATAGTLTLTVTGSVTNAQLEDVTGQADQTASEFVDVDTIISNDILSNDDLSVSPWTAAAATVTPNVYNNPLDSALTAGKFVPSASAAAHYINQTITYNVASGGVKAVVYAYLDSAIDKITLYQGGSATFAHFNLTTVTTTREANVRSSKITSLGGNWFKLEAVWAAGISLRIYASSGANGAAATAGDGVAGIGIYLPVAGAINDTQWFATNKDGTAIPDADLLGLATIPAAVTNTMLHCRDFTNAAWLSSVTGSELITNGDGGSTAGWSTLNTSLSLESGGLKVSISANGYGYAAQSFATVIGKTYQVSALRTSSNTTGNDFLQIGTGADDSSNGSVTITASNISIKFVATSITTWITLRTSTAALAGEYTIFDDISVKEAGVHTAKTQTGLDNAANSCSQLTFKAAGATILQTITAAAAAGCTGWHVKRVTGTGTIEITRDGGTTWLDIAPQLDTGSFYLAKIENTSVTNPVVGFRGGTVDDVIDVDGGINHLGTKLYHLPIITTTAAVTVNAQTLTYPTSGNISDTSGTIMATVQQDTWAAGGVVGSATHGLFASDATSGVQAKDGTNTASGETATPTGSVKLGCRWSGSSLEAFSATTYLSVGAAASYDGSFNLSTISVGLGVAGYVKDVAIYV